MARPLRIEFPGAFYHVIQRGIERKEIFISDKDYERFFNYLSAASIRYQIIIHAYCIMKNHYHLTIETKKANLSKVMHYINASYTTYFNIKRKRTGPLYQGRYKAIIIQADEYLHHLSSYIHLNPVRAHIVENPIDYSYSSYRYFVTNNKPPAWLNTNFILSFFNRNLTKARQLYKGFVLSNIGKDKEIITKNTIYGILLGDKGYLQWIQDNFLEKRKKDKEIPLLKKLIPRPKAEDIHQYIASQIKDKKQIKRFSVYFIRKYSDLRLKEIANMFNNLGYTGVSKIYKRIEGQLGTDKRLRNRLAGLEKGIMSKVKT